MTSDTYNRFVISYLHFVYSQLLYILFSFRNYVVQYVVELNDPNVTILLVQQLFGNYARLSRNKYGSHVVQKFLKIHYIDHSMIVYDLLKDIDTLLVDPFGNYVIQTAWFVCEVMNIRAVHCLMLWSLCVKIMLSIMRMVFGVCRTYCASF